MDGRASALRIAFVENRLGSIDHIAQEYVCVLEDEFIRYCDTCAPLGEALGSGMVESEGIGDLWVQVVVLDVSGECAEVVSVDVGTLGSGEAVLGEGRSCEEDRGESDGCGAEHGENRVVW